MLIKLAVVGLIVICLMIVLAATMLSSAISRAEERDADDAGFDWR